MSNDPLNQKTPLSQNASLKSTSLAPSLIQRVVQGVKYVVSGVTPQSWFGPGQPLAPIAQDPSQGAVGRAFDYQVSTNMFITTKQADNTGVSFEQIRALADNLDVLRLVIESRKDRLSALDWDIQSKDVKKPVNTDDVKAFFIQPSTEYSWGEWLRVLCEDVFVIDTVAIYPRMTKGGKLYSLDLVDGATIKRLLDATGRTPVAPSPAYQQILKGIQAVDYSADQLLYSRRNPRSNRIYGFSPVEQIIITVNIALRRQLWQLQHYTEGNIPEAISGVPDSWNAQQIAMFQTYFDSLLQGNTASRSRLKFVPFDPSKIRETKDATMKDAFDEWLARIVCYAFSVPPTPFIRDSNKATAESAAQLALEEGMQPFMVYTKNLFDSIIVKYFKRTDIEFIWKTKESVAPLVQAQIDHIYVTAGIRTVDEVRDDRGWGPKPVEAVDNAAPATPPSGGGDEFGKKPIEEGEAA